MTPGMFHLRLTMDIQLRGSYMKAFRRLSERTFENRVQVVIASVSGTFNNCLYTNLKLMTSTFRIFNPSSILLVSSFCVQSNVDDTLSRLWWYKWRHSAHYRRHCQSKSERNIKNRHSNIFSQEWQEQIKKTTEVFHTIGDSNNTV